MLLKTRSFFLPNPYPSPLTQYRFSHSPLPRSLRIILKNPSKPHTKRTYATARPDAGANASGSGTGGIPLGQINLGAGKAQKGVAIKDDITKSWKELSMPQKIVRTGTQTTNFAVVVVAVSVLVPSLTSVSPNSPHSLVCWWLMFLGCGDLLSYCCGVFTDFRNGDI